MRVETDHNGRWEALIADMLEELFHHSGGITFDFLLDAETDVIVRLARDGGEVLLYASFDGLA